MDIQYWITSIFHSVKVLHNFGVIDHITQITKLTYLIYNKSYKVNCSRHVFQWKQRKHIENIRSLLQNKLFSINNLI